MKKRNTVEEKQLHALQKGVKPTNPVQGVAAAWLWMKWASRNLHHIDPSSPALAEFRKITNDLTMAFFNRVYMEWNPSLLKDLASEMEEYDPDTWEPERDIWFLHEASKQGEVNLSKLAERMAELGTTVTKPRERKHQIDTKKQVILRRLRRKARSEQVKTLKPGRPNK